MCELLQMFLQNEKSLFLKSMQKHGTAMTFEELLSKIRKVKGCKSLIVSKRIQELLLENNILKKTPGNNFYVNENYSFEKVPSAQPDLKGWNVALYKRDIPEDLLENETTFVCVDDSGVPHLVFARNDDSWDNVVFEKYHSDAVFLPILWKRLDIPDNVFGILNNTDTNPSK